MIDLSVIIPVYNAENEISVCLDSLLNQVDVSLEIIIINDASNDLTLQILQNYQKRNSNITLIEYSCAITPQVRQAGNRLSGLTETAYASLLA